MHGFATTSTRMRRKTALVLALAASVSAALVLTAGSSASPAASGGGSITVWLSGTYAGATPGSTYRKWLDSIAARYKAKFGGSVKYVLTPINNAQFTACLNSKCFFNTRV